MKKLIYIFPIIFASFFVFYFVSTGLSSKNQAVEFKPVLGSPSDSLVNQIEIEFKEKIYLSNWIFLDATDDLSLINNLEEKLVSTQVAEQYNCVSLISAGFYTEDSKPVGYFKNDDGLVREFAQNRLFNSVLSVNYFETPRITRDVPEDEIRIGLQTGPLLIENANVLDFETSEDAARRIVAGVTGENKLVFIAFYSPNSTLIGPILSDLPGILSMWEEESEVKLADATNLDGGSASAFITGDFKLVESSKVGSFFCERSN